MGKPKAPPPPDYKAAAEAQGQASLEAAQATAKLNNPNIINPYGTQTTVYGGEPVFDASGYDQAMTQYNKELDAYNSRMQSGSKTFGGKFSPLGAKQPIRPLAPDRNSFYMATGDPNIGTMTQTFSPDQQALYDLQIQSQKNMGRLGIQGTDALRGIVGVPVDYSGLPAAPTSNSSRNDMYDAFMSRVNMDTDRTRDNSNSNLIAAGIRPGTEAYTRAMDQIGRDYNDARNQALLGSQQAAVQDFGMDTQARNNAIAQYLSQRQTPLNEINALMSGSQVNNPFAGSMGYQGGASAQAAPMFQAAQAQGQAAQAAYGQEVGGYNSMMSGLMGLGGSIGGAFLL